MSSPKGMQGKLSFTTGDTQDVTLMAAPVTPDIWWCRDSYCSLAENAAGLGEGHPGSD